MGNNIQNFLIIGTGPAGIAAAEAIRSQDNRARITLIGDDPRGYYSRPGLAYYLTGELPEKGLFPFTPIDFRKRQLKVLYSRVGAIEPSHYRVKLLDGKTLAYDRLLIATGARAARTDLPGTGLKGVVVLDNLNQARNILKLARRTRSAVVVGGGITALEIMPVAQFPGKRNWGYDGAYPFAVQQSYGGPDGLKKLVNECHKHGLAVILDVVYNHLGPDGAYLSRFSPSFFSSVHHTPWGPAVNLDGQDSSMVRRFLIENALHWIREYHIDGLRLDATHALIDEGPRHFLDELREAVHQERGAGSRALVMAEDDRNLARLIRPPNRFS